MRPLREIGSLLDPAQGLEGPLHIEAEKASKTKRSRSKKHRMSVIDIVIVTWNELFGSMAQGTIVLIMKG